MKPSKQTFALYGLLSGLIYGLVLERIKSYGTTINFRMSNTRF